MKELKKTEIVELTITRDSICYADDIDSPHKKIVKGRFYKNTKLFIDSIVSEYLPVIYENNYSWEIVLNGKTIGFINNSEVYSMIDKASFLDVNSIHFIYKTD